MGTVSKLSVVMILALGVLGGALVYYHVAATAPTANKTSSLPLARRHSWPIVKMSSKFAKGTNFMGMALVKNPNGDLVTVGGYNGTEFTANINEVLPQVKRLGTMPEPMHDMAAGYIGNILYIFGGGQSASSSNIVSMYRGKTMIIGQLSAPLSDATSVPYSYQGHEGLLLIGGYDGSIFRRQVDFVYVSRGRLMVEPVFMLPLGLRYTAVSTSGNKVFMAGGLKSTGVSQLVYEWHPGLSAAVSITKLPFARYQAASWVVPGFLMLAGGLNTAGNPTSQVVAINLSNHQVKVVGKLPFSLADMGYNSEHGIAYLTGGIRSNSGNENETIMMVHAN